VDGATARATVGGGLGRTAPGAVADGRGAGGGGTDAVSGGVAAREGVGGGVNPRGAVAGGADKGASRDATIGDATLGAAPVGGAPIGDATDAGGGATLRDGIAAGDPSPGGATDPATTDAGVLGSGALRVAAVPRAAGIEDAGRSGAAAAVRGAAGCGGADGASIVISSVRPTKPSRMAPTPDSSRILSDMPRRSAGRG
jgi:hypothetical protein